MAKKYVPEGAFLACDKGTSPSTLRVSNNVSTTIYGVAMATEADKLPFFNIKPMGLCKMKGSCTPVVLKWDDPKEGVKINGNRMLLEDSTCKCVFGGKIKIFFDRPSAVGYGLGKGKMPNEYIKDGFDKMAAQKEASERKREKILPVWMEGIADVGDWFVDLRDGLVEGAISGVVGLGETIYQVAQDPIGTGEAIGGMAKKGWEWVTDEDNLQNTYNSTVQWVEELDSEKIGNGLKDAAVWVAENPRKIGTSVGEFIPDAVVAVYTAGGSAALSASKKGLKELGKEAVEQAAKRSADDVLAVGVKKTLAETMEQLAKKESKDIAAVVAKSADEIAEDVAKRIKKIVDPPNTFRDSKGRLRNKNGTFAKDPKTKKIKTKKAVYQRNMVERRKALKRDAKDPNAGLDQKARDYIDKHDGKKVPNKRHKDYDGDNGYEVSHEIPLYTARTNNGKKSLDNAKNMKTQPKSKHRKRHKRCGDQYHEYGPANKPKLEKIID